jgi:para-nitrobenzyl esterase
MPFVFDNVSDPLVQQLTGSAPDIFPLAERVSGAWAAFAATGSPNSKGFPRWPAYSAADRNVMMINSTSEVVKDPARQSREVIENILFPA